MQQLDTHQQRRRASRGMRQRRQRGLPLLLLGMVVLAAASLPLSSLAFVLPSAAPRSMQCRRSSPVALRCELCGDSSGQGQHDHTQQRDSDAESAAAAVTAWVARTEGGEESGSSSRSSNGPAVPPKPLSAKGPAAGAMINFIKVRSIR